MNIDELEKIYKQYFNYVYKYLLILSHDNDLTEEITQETFSIAIKEIDKFKGESKISVWLCQIAKHLYFKEMKRKKKMASILDEKIEEVESKISIEEQIEFKDEKEKIYRKIEALDDNTKEVMKLRLEADLSFKQIGDILGKTENWARVTFYRGKQKIKKVGDKNE